MSATRVVALATASLGLVTGARAARAQDTLFFPPRDRIAIRYLPSMPSVNVANVRVHTVVGSSASISYAAFDSGGATPLHHHTREQIDVGLSGVFDMTLGDQVETLTAGTAVIVPADVAHSIVNNRSGVATAIEFHTVPRPDLVPPQPKMTFPVGPAAAPVAPSARLIVDIAAGSGKTLTGKTCTVRWRELAGPTDVRSDASTTELFVYIARGSVRLAAAGDTSVVGAGTVVIVPAAMRDVIFSPSTSSGEGAAVVEFALRAR